jgi:ComF family protein
MIEVKGFWNSFSSRALDLLYPRKCGLCGEWCTAAICPTCRGEFRELNQGLVRIRDDGPLDYRVAVFAYEGRAAQAVRRLKYSRITSLVAPLAEELRRTAEKSACIDADLLVPIPIHWTRRAARGFNQAELLASSLPREKLMRSALLHRIRATRPQVGLSREQRLLNLEGAFRASSAVEGKHVLLIDDVVTTMQTARECAGALKAAGASEVGILALTGEAEWAP